LASYRYAAEQTVDGLSGEEGTFNMCTPLADGGFNACGASRSRPTAGGLLDIRKTAGMANHLGLYSEETSLCGEACGNFPRRSPDGVDQRRV
jgi:hypothetical protein